MQRDLRNRPFALVGLCDVVEPPPRHTSQGLRFSVQESVVLTGGEQVVVRELGWGSVPSRPMSVDDQWRRESPDRLRQQVLNVVLPDDAEQTGEAHAWELFVAALADQSIPADVLSLKALPYLVLFAPRVHARLDARAESPG